MLRLAPRAATLAEPVRSAQALQRGEDRGDFGAAGVQRGRRRIGPLVGVDDEHGRHWQLGGAVGVALSDVDAERSLAPSSPRRTNTSASSTAAPASSAGSARLRRCNDGATLAEDARSDRSSDSLPSVTRWREPRWQMASIAGKAICETGSNGCKQRDLSLETLTPASWRPPQWLCFRAACSSLRSVAIPTSSRSRSTPRDRSSGRHQPKRARRGSSSRSLVPS